jgi:hypothetical protein
MWLSQRIGRSRHPDTRHRFDTSRSRIRQPSTRPFAAHIEKVSTRALPRRRARVTKLPKRTPCRWVLSMDFRCLTSCTYPPEDVCSDDSFSGPRRVPSSSTVNLARCLNRNHSKTSRDRALEPMHQITPTLKCQCVAGLLLLSRLPRLES